MSDIGLMSFSGEALERIIEIRDQEPGDDEYGLLIEITGLQGTQFGYSLSFVPLGETGTSDHVERHGDLTVIIPSADTANMTGATLAMSSDPMTPGLAIDNPNNPSPQIPDVPDGDLTGPLAEQVAQVLDRQVNPAIAAHGGNARLVSEENGVVYLQLGGGCQGCGMAAMTLRQGIERILREAIPEIVEIVDVTDHQGGENPYYAASKKG
ncbi:MAG: NifU family protein [bacterium]|nr:NifU family protein [bacterium]MDE0288326.1 NifU family protein [bacterium]MDE0437877.1 NifU family protein [bacterium]